MEKQKKHKWVFSPRFRRQAFGWRSKNAIERVKEAVKEIKAAARKNPLLGAEGAVLLLETVLLLAFSKGNSKYQVGKKRQ